MSAKAILIFLLTFSLCENLKAQDSSNARLPIRWDLQTCLVYAKENNIQLNNLRLDQKSSEQNLLMAKAARLPDVTGAYSHNLVHGNNVNSAGNILSRNSSSGSLSINSSWTIYNGGYLNKDIRQKDLSLEAAGLDVEEGENDITLQITQAYLAILLDKENILSLEDLVATSEAQVKQGQEQFKAGTIARKDLVQLEAQLANDKYTLTTAANTHRQDILTLKQLLQLPSEIPFDIVKPDTLMADRVVPPLADVQKAALENMPEIKSSELGVETSILELEKTKAAYRPALSIGAGLSTGYADGADPGFFNQLDNNFYQQIGVNLSIPIFTKRMNKTHVEQAKIGVEQAKLALNDEKLLLSQAVEQAYIDAVNAQSQFDAAEEQLNYTKESYRIASKQLEVGAVNMVEFLQQKNGYIQALQSYLQAKYSASLSSKIYEFYRDKWIEL